MDMNIEVLETALEHARKDNIELKRRLEVAVGVRSAGSHVTPILD